MEENDGDRDEAAARAALIRMHRKGILVGLLAGFILGWASACAFDGLLLWVATW